MTPVDSAHEDARLVGKGIRLGGSRDIVAALQAAAVEGPLTPDRVERLAHPDWDRVTFEEESSEPVAEGTDAVGFARLSKLDQDDTFGRAPSWTVAASWFGWLPGVYEDRTTALLAYGYVLGGEGGGSLEELRNRINRGERRPIALGDLIVFAERGAPDA